MTFINAHGSSALSEIARQARAWLLLEAAVEGGITVTIDKYEGISSLHVAYRIGDGETHVRPITNMLEIGCVLLPALALNKIREPPQSQSGDQVEEATALGLLERAVLSDLKGFIELQYNLPQESSLGEFIATTVVDPRFARVSANGATLLEALEKLLTSVRVVPLTQVEERRDD